MNGAGGGVLAIMIGVLLLLTVNAAGEPQSESVAAAQRQVEIAQAERDQARAQLDAERDAAAERLASSWRPWRTAATNLAVIALTFTPILLIVLALLWLQPRLVLVWPRRGDATLPLRLRDLTPADARGALEHRAARELEEARKPNVPEHYAPHFAYRNQQDIQGIEAPQLEAVAAPGFAQLPLRVESVVLGHDGHGLVQRDWRELQSLAIGGTTGTGKTWTGVSLVLQALHAGHRVALVDPHAADEDSLSARLEPVRSALWRPVAVTPGEANETLGAFGRLIDERGQGVDMDRTPVTLVVDEFTKMMRGSSAEQLANILEGVVSEGRKLGVRCILLGQRWSASRTGGSGDLRDVIPNVILHRMKRKDALMLSGLDADDCPDTLALEPGECYLLERDDVMRVAQPRMSDADVAAFAGALLPSLKPAPVVPRPSPAAAVDVSPAGPRQGAGSTEALREKVLSLLLAGHGYADITDMVSVSKKRGGGAWNRTRREVEEIIREELRRRGG